MGDPGPAEIAIPPAEKPETLTGEWASVYVPSPSCPLTLFPQHVAPPLVVRAHVWMYPAEILDTPDERPETLTGVELLVLVPFPS